jgi:hypothetical protein
MIPLMAQQDYSAKGWLGLILGTRLWYPMWDAEKDDDAAFEKRLDNVVREIGDRGQKPQQQQQAYQTTQQIQMSASAESAAGAAPNRAPAAAPSTTRAAALEPSPAQPQPSPPPPPATPVGIRRAGGSSRRGTEEFTPSLHHSPLHSSQQPQPPDEI